MIGSTYPIMIVVILILIALVVLVATDAGGGNDGPADDDSVQAGDGTLPVVRSVSTGTCEWRTKSHD